MLECFVYVSWVILIHHTRHINNVMSTIRQLIRQSIRQDCRMIRQSIRQSCRIPCFAELFCRIPCFAGFFIAEYPSVAKYRETSKVFHAWFAVPCKSWNKLSPDSWLYSLAKYRETLPKSVKHQKYFSLKKINVLVDKRFQCETSAKYQNCFTLNEFVLERCEKQICLGIDVSCYTTNNWGVVCCETNIWQEDLR